MILVSAPSGTDAVIIAEFDSIGDPKLTCLPGNGLGVNLNRLVDLCTGYYQRWDPAQYVAITSTVQQQ